MPETRTAKAEGMQPKDRIFVALDVDDISSARRLVGRLGDAVGGFKIGLQLFTNAGPAFVREVASSGTRVFLDLKFHDIPNTVAKACVEAARLGVWMLNVHAAGGREMMTRARDEAVAVCSAEGIAMPRLIGVTVLTSSDAGVLSEIGIEKSIEEQVLRLAHLTHEAGLDGVVASPNEAAMIRQGIPNRDFLIVTPGIRPVSGTNDDQKRVNTFAAALAEGADFVVIGRPITQAADPLTAVEEILSEIK
jgi:orotidine-5'-phosphate decarboxylase